MSQASPEHGNPEAEDFLCGALFVKQHGRTRELQK
jgi:hypothetical protein